MTKPIKTPKPTAEEKAPEKRETKQSKIITLLEREEGATIAELMTATEWQSHSVRGHLSNLRKKRKLPIETFTNKEGKRGYRIVEVQAAS